MKSPSHLVFACLTFAIASLLSGCASVGVPLPPSLDLPKPPTDLRAVRKGDKVFLFWSAPTQTTDRQNVRRSGPTLVCRSLEATMSDCGNFVGEAPPGLDTTAPQSGKNAKPQMSFVDTLPAELEQQNPTRMITYAVESLNPGKRGAGLSNQVRVALAPMLPPPANVKAQVISDGVVLTWDCETPSASSAGLRYIYRVYRRSIDTGADVKLADETCPGGRYEDRAIEWQKTYEYRVTVVTFADLDPLAHPCPVTEQQTPDGQTILRLPTCLDVVIVEGDDSPIQKVFTNDVFPPGVPSGLQAVFSGTGQAPFVDLIWAPDTDADLAGYNVYRREGDGRVVKINSELVKAPAFRDQNVASGKTYVYSVSAMDLRGNESGKSEEATEAVPQN
jgi:hypothetical protein